ncbi:hypothetical protein IT411_01980, partial [Candidatus Peregrinibacteria bacterium]|nr:hypothetical protein [Candidatus Peregrinibacteria bacterium]
MGRSDFLRGKKRSGDDDSTQLEDQAIALEQAGPMSSRSFSVYQLLELYRRQRNAKVGKFGDDKMIDDVQSIRASLSGVLATVQPATLDKIEAHLQRYPDYPRGGFPSVFEYAEYVFSMNGLTVHEFEEYQHNKPGLRLKDPEVPGKFRKKIVASCADGRNTFELHIPPSKVGGRFDIAFAPIAGNIIFPEIPLAPSRKALLGQLSSRKIQMVFDRFEYLYGGVVAEAVREYDHGNGETSSVNLEFQSHFHSESQSTLGCDAHGCNLLHTQLETAKNAALSEMWAKSKYADLFRRGFFRITRTAFD